MEQPEPIVQTVLGPIGASQLGFTHTHEHLLVDLWQTEATRAFSMSERRESEEEIRLDNYYRVRRHHRLRTDLQLTDERVAIAELERFRALGGVSMVEATSGGIGRDPLGLARISRASGVNVVMGSGYYVKAHHPPEVALLSEQEITDEIIADVRHGAGGTGVRAGIIGEIGMTWPVDPDEEKVLRAAVDAQRETGAALLIHPGRSIAAPLHHMKVVRDAGGDCERTIMSHLDRTLFTVEDTKALAATGCYLEYDLFGQESSYYSLAPIDMPNDATRVDLIMALIAAGYGSKIVVAQDICHKSHLAAFGGEGYGHLLENVLPLMRRKGMSETEIRAVVVDNPASILPLRR
jgi:phosphotriesterase-related protein